MPTYEFPMFATVKAANEQDARDRIARATALLEEQTGVILSPEDGPPVPLDDDEDED